MIRRAVAAMMRLAHIWLSLIVLAVALSAHLAKPAIIITLRDAAFDVYQRWSPRDYQAAPVRILDIDDESLEKLGQWPWPRNTLARLVDRLQAMGAAAIVFDIVFAEPDRTSPARVFKQWTGTPPAPDLETNLPDHDRIFAESLGKGRVVTGFVLVNRATPRAPAIKAGFATAGDDPRLFLPVHSGAVTTLPQFEEAAAGNGALNFTPGRDGVIRRVPMLLRLGETLYPTLVAEALRVAQGASTYVVKSSGASAKISFGAHTGITTVRVGTIPVPTDAEGRVWIHYTRAVAQRYLPAWKLLAGQVHADSVKGFIVLVGSSAAGLQDTRFSPLGNVIPGVEIHAQAIEQIIQGTYLTRPDWANGAELLFMVTVSVALVLLIAGLGALWSAVIGLTAAAGAGAASWYAFVNADLLFDPLSPVMTTVAVYLVCSVLRHMHTERQQRWIRDAFSSYVSPNLVWHLIENPDQLSLGGERRECTFLFTDLANFTSLVEQSEPEVIVSLLNEYLDGMVQIAFQHDGTLDKIVGDAVTIIFSAPVVQPDHAARGVACALAMDSFAQAFAEAKRKEGIPLGKTRIGVNSGLVIIGNFGGDTVFDYTAHGDAINTAARMESVNKHLGTRVCISGFTVAGCPDFIGRPVGTLVLKGKTKGIEAFEPLTEAEAGSSAVAAYLAAFELLERRDPDADTAFAALAENYPDDPLAAFHLKRLRAGETGTTIVMTEK